MKAAENRFHGLDFLRGIAALSVVFWHWKMLFAQGTYIPNVSNDSLPFYDVFFLFYEKGYLAVQLFFALSGFIFFKLYKSAIHSGSISFLKFMKLRFSRLYPLHVLTLVLVAALQLYSLEKFGTFQVFKYNDLFHFCLQLGFASNWGFEKGFSFNAPIWSVSVEWAVYILFFVLVRTRLFKWAIPAFILILGLSLWFWVDSQQLLLGVAFFFWGGLMALVYDKFSPSIRFVKVFSVATAIGWLIAIFLIRTNQVPVYFSKQLHIQPFADWLFPLYGATLLAFAWLERFASGFFSKVSFLGNYTYSMYLLHFPLQLLILLVINRFLISPTIFYSPWSLVGFFVVLISISDLSYRKIELPFQKVLRGK